MIFSIHSKISKLGVFRILQEYKTRSWTSFAGPTLEPLVRNSSYKIIVIFMPHISETYNQFHQHFLHSFFVQISGAKLKNARKKR